MFAVCGPVGCLEVVEGSRWEPVVEEDDGSRGGGWRDGARGIMCVLHYPVCRTEGGGTMMATPKMALLENRHGAVKMKKKDEQVHVPVDQQAVLVLGGQGFASLSWAAARTCALLQSTTQSAVQCWGREREGEGGRSGTVVEGAGRDGEMGGCPEWEWEWERERAQASVDMRCQAAKAQMAMARASENWSSPWALMITLR